MRTFREKLDSFDFHGVAIPEHIRGGIERYVEKGIPNGSGLTTLFSGDAFGAAVRLDEECQMALGAIIKFAALHMPRASYGSRDAVRDWTGAKGVIGLGGWGEFGYV